MSWDGCGEGPGTDLDGIRWYGRCGMSMEGLGWVKRAWDWDGGP